MSARVLLTGATGFVGKVILHELLRRREELGLDGVEVVVRSGSGRSAEERLQSEVIGSPCFRDLRAGWAQCVRAVDWDLTVPHTALTAHVFDSLAPVTHVIHCAASVEFHLPVAEAAEANVTTALHVLGLAREIPGLAAMASVSTAYVTPHASDTTPIHERMSPLSEPADALYRAICAGDYEAPEREAALLAANRHPNSYTLTKCVAEHLLVARRGSVPLTLLRPSIVNASFERPFPGWIDSPAAFALFALGIATGRMRAVVADPEARLDLIPVDVVARRVVDAAFDTQLRSALEPPIRHVVAGFDRSPSLRHAADRVQDFFAHNPTAGGRGPTSWLHYLGPAGLRYRFHHWHQHRRRAVSRPIAEQLGETNERFAYFTSNTFRFESSVPFDDPGWSVDGYLDAACAGIYRQLLSGDETRVPIGGRGFNRRGGDALWALRRPTGNAFIRAAGWLVAKALHLGVDQATVDVESFRRALEAVPPGTARVIAPSHRSYLDFVLVSFLCFARPDLGLAVPHVAAAMEFSRIPLLGWLLERMHAFYLERGRGREDKALTRRVHTLVRDGRVLELFIEGSRSRSRRFLAPRRGMLRSLQSTGHPIAILPVAIAYDHVPEEATFLEELRGGARPPMRLRDLLGWSARLLRGRVDLGHVHLACGRPVPLDLARDVGEASREVIEELRGAMAASTHHLRSFLAATGDEALSLEWLRGEIERRGGRVLDATRLDREVEPSIERCMREHYIDRFVGEAAACFPASPAVLDRAGEAAAPPRPVGDADRDLRRERLLRALFSPSARDWAATTRALARIHARGDGPAPTPEGLLASLDGAHLPDVERAYEALFARGMLVRDVRGGGPAWGPRVGELAAYAECCAADALASSAAPEPGARER